VLHHHLLPVPIHLIPQVATPHQGPNLHHHLQGKKRSSKEKGGLKENTFDLRHQTRRLHSNNP
jgi:hypothetical protein